MPHPIPSLKCIAMSPGFFSSINVLDEGGDSITCTLWEKCGGDGSHLSERRDEGGDREVQTVKGPVEAGSTSPCSSQLTLTLTILLPVSRARVWQQNGPGWRMEHGP